MNIKRYTLIILKPDTMAQFLDNTIIEGLEANGLSVIKRKITTLTTEQAEQLYSEKRDINYFPTLIQFMNSGECMCLIARSNNEVSATEQAKKYRDWARQNLKLTRFKVTEDDVVLLNRGVHPQQSQITREMALRNLVHVSDDFESDCRVFVKMLTDCELDEMKDREPELHAHITTIKNSTPESLRELLPVCTSSKERR